MANKEKLDDSIVRCNDYKCPTNFCCVRFKGLNDNKPVIIKDFKGRLINGLCDNFLNADFYIINK